MITPKTPTSAFTLIEALVSLSIMIILMSFAFPLGMEFLRHNEDDILQMQLLDAMSLAKFEAKARHQAVALCKSQNQKTCGGNWQNGQLIFIDQYADGVVHDQSQILTVVQMRSSHGGIYWKSFPAYRDYLQFLPQELHSDNGTFWHCHAQSARWAIILNKAGRARTVYPDECGVIKDSHGQPLKCR